MNNSTIIIYVIALKIKHFIERFICITKRYCKFSSLVIHSKKKIIRSYDSPLKHEYGLSEKHSGGVTDHYNFSSRHVHLV